MRIPLFAPVLALLCVSSCLSNARPQVGPTVQEVVEFTRIAQPDNRADAQALQRLVSPDGLHAFIVTRKSNVATDTNRYEIQLLSLDPAQLGSGRPSPPQTVFRFDAAQDGSYADAAIQRVHWIDDRTLAFSGRLKDGIRQAYCLDVFSHALTQLTHAATPVVSFALSQDKRRLVYAAQVPNPPMREGARSYVYGNQSFWTVKWGQQRLVSQLRKYQFYVADVGMASEGRASQARPLGDAFLEANVASPVVNISPDGRWAILPRYERDRTLPWSRDYPMLDEFVARFALAQKDDPLRYYSGAMVRTARRMVAWRLDDAKEQTIVDAPDDSLPAEGQFRQDRIWLGKGESLILAGTQLPLAEKGASASSSYVIEYWPDRNRWAVVTALKGRLRQAHASDAGFVVSDDSGERHFRRGSGTRWEEVAGPATKVDQIEPRWSLKVEQALNQPPDMVAVEKGGRTVRLTTLNPQFDAKTWGTMKSYSWRDAKGRGWIGGLMTPAGASPGVRLPLVIQVYNYAPENFYLDGPNAGTAPSAYAGRAFMREGMLVLGMDFVPEVGREPRFDRVLRLSQFQDGVRAAVKSLVEEGRVDPERVGIIGWSTTGEQVLNLVTFTDVPIRAATSADGDVSSLFSYAIGYGAEYWQHMEGTNNGKPFGPTRSEWIRNDPSLNTECVRAAMRFEVYNVPVYGNYDVYALLRRQYKPVEMVFIPGGSHMLSTPSERMVSLQGNLDWFRFWLKGEKRTEPMLAGETDASLQSQYEAWGQMEKMKLAEDAKPRCSRVSAMAGHGAP